MPRLVAAIVVVLGVVGVASAQGGSRIVIEGAGPLTVRPRGIAHGDSSHCGGAAPPRCLQHVSSMSFRGVARTGAVRSVEIMVSASAIGPTRIDLASSRADALDGPGDCGRGSLAIGDTSGSTSVATRGWIEVRRWTPTRAMGRFEATLEGGNVVRGSFDVALPRPPRQPPCDPRLP